MRKIALLAMTVFALGWLGIAVGHTAPSTIEDAAEPLLIGELEPKLDGETVTLRFKVTELTGISQFREPGQAPKFAIETEKGSQKNLLSVWVIDELANVLDRLQMSAYQENAIKPGTEIVATGELTLHKTIPNQYFFNISRWQDFRILPAKREK